ncbi:MAG: hypothetical protein IJD42_04460 [Clostridia bacterium]|nr:hypothetical protein [Clostridia bacterium]
MAQYTPDQVFGLACAAYDDARFLVREMSNIATQVIEDFPVNVPMGQYDLVLQAALLNAAVSDGKFEDIEKQFIAKITDYCDLMLLINAELKNEVEDWVDITWDHVAVLDEETRNKLVGISVAIVEKHTESLVKLFAIIDKAIEERDFIAELREITTRIIVTFTLVDGDDLESENVKNEALHALAVFEYIVGQKWSAITDETDEPSAEDTPADAPDSADGE